MFTSILKPRPACTPFLNQIITSPRSNASRRAGRPVFTLALPLLAMLALAHTSAGRAQDLLPEPVQVAATSAESAEMTVDLSDPTKFPFSSTGKWKGYLEFLGKPGTERSLGQPDLFLPFLQDANDMTFLNIRGQLQFDNTDVHEYNIGLGHRHMFQEWILGGYGYYDHRNTQFNNAYRQFTGGLELMSVDWAFRVNGYLPENKTETVMSGVNVSVIRPGDQINVQVDGIVQEKALPGIDGEVGYLLPIPWEAYRAVFDETRVYAAGYHFFSEDQFDSVTGPRGRVEWRAYDLPVLGPGSRFMMGVEAQWDEPRGSQAFGLFSLRIPFDVFADKSTRKQLTGLDRRMLQPVIRDVDIVTSEHNVPAEILPALNWQGKVITKGRDVNPGDDLQEVIDEHDDEVTLLVLHGDADEVEEVGNGEFRHLIETGEVTLGEDHTLTSAGKVVTLGFNSQWLGAGSIDYTPAGTPVGLKGSGLGFESVISMGPGSHLNAMTVDGSGSTEATVRIEHPGNYLVTDTMIQNDGSGGGGAYGLHVDHDDAVATIRRSRFQDIRFRNLVLNRGEANIYETEFIGTYIDSVDGYSLTGIFQKRGILRVEDVVIQGQFAWSGITIDGGRSVIKRTDISFDEIEIGGLSSPWLEPVATNGQGIVQHGIEVHNTLVGMDVDIDIDRVTVTSAGGYGFLYDKTYIDDDPTTISRIEIRNSVFQNGRHTSEEAFDLVNGTPTDILNNGARGWGVEIQGTAIVDIYDTKVINNANGGVKSGATGANFPIVNLHRVEVSGNRGFGVTAANEGIIKFDEGWEELRTNYVFGNGEFYEKNEMREGGNGEIFLDGAACISGDNSIYDVSCND